MLGDHIQNFVESRIEKVHVSDTQNYRKAKAVEELTKAALQSFFTDATIGNRLLEQYDIALYGQTVEEMNGAYRQGFLDGMRLLSAMSAPLGRVE